MQLPLFITNKEFMDEVFHWVIVPMAIFLTSKIGTGIRTKARAYALEAAMQALKPKLIEEAIAPVVHEMFAARTPVLRLMMDEANDELLKKINGTYVRSKEQEIRDANVFERLSRIERKIDSSFTNGAFKN